MDLKMYDELKDKPKYIVCDVCKHEFPAGSVKILYERVRHKVNLSEIVIEYFECPKCKERYIVSACDDELYSLRKQYQRQRILLNNTIAKKAKNSPGAIRSKELEIQRIDKKMRNQMSSMLMLEKKIRQRFLKSKEQYLVVDTPHEGDVK